MAEKNAYRVIWGRHRFYMPIGLKTLSAFLIVISIMAGGIAWYTTGTLSRQIEEKVTSELYGKLQSSWHIYYSRLDELRFGMLQAASVDHVQRGVAARDYIFLDRLVASFKETGPHIDFFVITDAGKQVLARSGHQRRGDVLRLEEVLNRVLQSGEVLQTTVKVDRELLALENESSAARIERFGLVQLVAAPVIFNGEIVGALCAGILLNGSRWLPDAIYRFLSVNSAVFASVLQDARIVSGTALPKSVFSPLVLMPSDITARIAQGESFSGRIMLEGEPVYVAAGPILDLQGRPLGAIAVGMSTSEVRELITAIHENVLVLTVLGVLVSLIMAALAYRDTTSPVKALGRAMTETAAGNLSVRVELQTYDEFEELGKGFNQMLADLEARDRRITRFNELSRLLITSLDPDILLNKALSSIVTLTGSQMGIVYLHEERSGALLPVTGYGVAIEDMTTLKAGEGIAGVCAAERKTMVLQDIPEENLLLETSFAKVRPKGVAWFAMCCKEKLLGVVAIGSLQLFNEEEVQHLEFLVAQIAVALDNALIHRQVERLSATDSLTGLFNRRHFLEQVNIKLEEAARYGFAVSVLVIDIDYFKKINDKRGHIQGDAVLVDMARLLQKNTRANDVWARYGGEEFVGCLPHCDPIQAMRTANKVRQAVEDHTFPALNRGEVTISIGIASSTEEGVHTLDDLIRIADARLYKAKEAGRNWVTGFLN